MKKAFALIAVVALASLPLAACGGDDDDGGGGGGGATTTQAETTGGGGGGGGETTTLQLMADPGGALKYDKDSLSAPAGTITIDFENPASITHDVVVEQDGKELGRTELISQASDSVTLTLDQGRYTYYCSVPGHREAGMEGTLSAE